MLGIRNFLTGKQGVGEPPSAARQGASMPEKRWINAGQYTVRALWPMDAMKLQFQLASMFGEQVVIGAFDLMLLAAHADEPQGVDFRGLWGTLRAAAAGTAPMRPGLIRDAVGDTWRAAIKRFYDLMPEEREMRLPEFIAGARPYLEAIGPMLRAIDADAAMDIIRHMLIVKHAGGSGLYVYDQPCVDDSMINAMVPDQHLPTLAFAALLFNLRPFMEAGGTTAPSPGPPAGDHKSTAPTQSKRGGTTASSTNTNGRRRS